ncbi:nucleotidyltransferase family protein [Microscilla marina]|uniref:Nucleotidyltransferase family protein n=1 Tax=Microscilla marina ATCC 23134 TaxID=313606 RepID=A1ZD06_MICM2|nr:nucleotidyltransferase family protein [Microscilla marina]EAY31545.1 conserved hypothetical protein [Microscilla marina ATCC 23134]
MLNNQTFFYDLATATHEKLLTQLMNNDVLRKDILFAVREVQNDFGQALLYVSAGFVRNLYWDYAHGFATSTPLNDVDVVYFDEGNLSKKQDQQLESILYEQLPKVNWSVKNQARMHQKSGHVPYTSLHHALSNWVETATAIGVRAQKDNSLSFVAPWGFGDLFDLILRPTPYFADKPAIMLERIQQKGWLQHWTKLSVKF